jgi:hypothetical protein
MRNRAKKRLLAALLLLTATVTGQADDRGVDEASVVVAYLYKFGKFIEWPATAFASPDVPMQFCIYGEDSLGSVTSRIAGKRVSGHTVEVNYVKRGGALLDCHLLYIDVSERLYVKPILNLIREAPILTVSEIDGFAAAGGIIGLIYTDNKLKFEINTTAASQAGLHISSQLLRLAVDVIGEVPP